MFFEVKRLCFSYYRSSMTLKDVSFSAQKSSKTLILASKDMGKTTTLKVLSGFEDSRFGNIYFNGKELKEISDAEKSFSLVLSSPVFLENKTIKENLDYQCDVCGLEKFSDEKIVEILKEFNVDKDANVKVKKLSTFEKLKLQIVRALIKNPNVLFLDDQFERLKDDKKLKMVEVYKKLLNDSKLTIIYTIGEDTFKFLKENKISLNYQKVLYLNLANVQEFKSVDEFFDSYASLDALKFHDNCDFEMCYIEKEKDAYFLCREEFKLFKFDSKYNKELDKLKLEFGDIEEVLIYLKNGEKLAEIDSKEFNLMIKEKSIFIYSNLTGNLIM